MDMKTQPFALLCALFIFAIGCSNTKPEAPSTSHRLTYRDLIIKDYDEMLAMVKKHTVAAHKIVINSENNPDWEHDAKLELLHAERLILSRPDSDNMASKLAFEVRREISSFGSYDDLLEILTKESIQAFNPDMRLPTVEQTTYLFILENLMAEMKPNVSEDTHGRQMLEEIRDAKIQVPHDVMRERKLQGMFLTDSPSEEAHRILVDAGFDKKR
jgi:hypothetical protein